MFESALATKNRWRVLFSYGMWGEVIKTKYLKLRPIIEWIRGWNKVKEGISNIWSSMLQSFHVLSDWHALKPRNGQQIKVGEDPLVGSDSFYKLSDKLVNILHEKGSCYLAQVSRMISFNNLVQKWKSTIDLGIIGAHQVEWMKYIT